MKKIVPLEVDVRRVEDYRFLMRDRAVYTEKGGDEID